MKQLLLGCSVLWLSANLCLAAGPDPIVLWPEGAPGAHGTEPKDIPQIRIYPAEESKATGACIVVLPGGGYGALAMDHEGHQVAVWLNSIGVTAAVVTYRLGPDYRFPAPLEDAQRGIRYVRAHAAELKIDPNRVGILGFSAGGHLASTVSTHFDKGQADSPDPVARESSRPDFSVLCYPVISLNAPYTHQGSRKNLLGPEPDPALVENLSNEKQVTPQTPPTFIFQTNEDTAVPAENCLAYYQALRNNKVPAELHIYQNGAHGVGLAPGNPILNTWKDRLADWLKVNGFLAAAKRGAIKGEIKRGGAPLNRGAITFYPDGNRNGPIAYSMVSRGKFAIDAKTGPMVGVNRISIYALGDISAVPTVDDAHEIVSAERSGIVFDVVEGANGNQLLLDLP